MTCRICLSTDEAWVLPGASRPGLWREWLFDEAVPRDEAGYIALCRDCQLGVVGNRGLVPFLARVVIALAVARGGITHDGGLTHSARRYAKEHPWVTVGSARNTSEDA